MSRKTGRALILLLSLAGAARAGDVTMKVTTDRTAISVGGTVNVSITVTTGVTSSIPEPVFEGLEDFDIVGRSSSSSSSLSIVNGTFSSEKTITYRYAMTPLRSGKRVIPSARLEVGGEEYRTDPVTITVTERGGTLEPPEPQQSDETTHSPDDQLREDIFIHAAVNRDSLYTEQAVVLEYTLYSRVTIFDVSMVELPESAGFWWEEDESYSGGTASREIVSGRAYTAYPLKRYVLYPLEPGEKAIKPLSLGCRVRVRSRDLFDSFSIFGRERTVTVSSDSVSLTVLPIPEKGKPPGYRGAVGDFRLRAELDRQTVASNEPLTLRVTIEGTGNFMTMGPPAVDVPESVSSYDPDEKTDIRFAGDNLRGRKTYEYILLPRETGSFAVSDVSFSFFDPAKRTYVERSTGPISFTVEQGASTAGYRSPSSSEAVLLGEDIRYIKEVPRSIRSGSRRGTLVSLSIAANILSLILFGGVLMRRKRTEKIFSNRALRRHRLSGRELKRSLREAEAHLGSGNSRRLAQVCERAVVEFIGNRLDRETKGMTIRELTALLGKQRVEAETMRIFAAWHEACQSAGFSPESMDRSDDREFMERTRELARKLGEELP